MIANFSKKRNSEPFNRDILFKIIAILLVILIIFLIFVDIGIYKNRKKMDSQLDAYRKKIEVIEKDSQNLKEEIANSENQEYLEKIAYEQLDQARPGEVIYSFVMPKEKQDKKQGEGNSWNIFSGWLSGALNWIKSSF